MSHFLGVDGGGSKTVLCVITGDGEVAASIRTRGCYYLEAAATEGPALVEQVLADAVPSVCAAAGVAPADLDFAFFGLPGYGEVHDDVAVLDAVPRRVLGHDRYRCGNDMVCGWAGSLGLADGINVVSGTGSIAYGERLGRGVRVGGWGELFGDEGSGYWIGVRALQAYSQMEDGRLVRSELADLLDRELGLSTPLDLVGVVQHRWGGDRGRVASLAPIVAHAAEGGDPVAVGILTEAGSELVRLVQTAARALEFDGDEEVPISTSGGIFHIGAVRSSFELGLRQSSRPYDLRPPMLGPELGAALYAAHLSGRPLPARSVEALRSNAIEVRA